MFFEWRPIRWQMYHPDLELVELQVERDTASGALYRLDLRRDEGTATSAMFEASSERLAKDRAAQEIRDFVDLLKGRMSWSTQLAKRRK